MAGRIGYTACGCCGQPEAAVTETNAGTLSLTCHKCQFSAYAKPGTKASRLIRERMTPDEDAQAPDAPAATPTPAAPAPKTKPARTAFTFQNL
jgi:hypothetical protein